MNFYDQISWWDSTAEELCGICCSVGEQLTNGLASFLSLFLFLSLCLVLFRDSKKKKKMSRITWGCMQGYLYIRKAPLLFPAANNIKGLFPSLTLRPPDTVKMSSPSSRFIQTPAKTKKLRVSAGNCQFCVPFCHWELQLELTVPNTLCPTVQVWVSGEKSLCWNAFSSDSESILPAKGGQLVILFSCFSSFSDVTSVNFTEGSLPNQRAKGNRILWHVLKTYRISIHNQQIRSEENDRPVTSLTVLRSFCDPETDEVKKA